MRNIAVVTGSRAEYGLLRPLLKRLQASDNFNLQLMVCCMHWLDEFGLMHHSIEDDGFTIDAKVDMLLANDDPAAITKSMGLGMIGFSDAFERLSPDLVLVLGDRFEIVAAAQAAFVSRIPIAHIHGGELTQGSLDDGFRHVITKLSHLHFTAAEPYRQRVIQLGENPERVFNVGAIGLDNVSELELLSKKELENVLEISLDAPCFLVTYHPATLAIKDLSFAIQNLFLGLQSFGDAKIIFTKSSADEGGRLVGKLIDEYAEEIGDRITVFNNLGTLNYLSLLQYVDVVIGNSSSGLIEAPYFGKPTVNIGHRQDGRLKAQSIIDCEEDGAQIKSAISQALSKRSNMKIESLLGRGGVSDKIMAVLKEMEFSELFKKHFYDCEVLNRAD